MSSTVTAAETDSFHDPDYDEFDEPDADLHWSDRNRA